MTATQPCMRRMLSFLLCSVLFVFLLLIGCVCLLPMSLVEAAGVEVTEAEMGTLRIAFTAGGERFSDADLELYQNDKYVASIYYNYDAGYFQATVPPGVYDVRMTPYIEGYPQHYIKGLQVTAGGTTTERVEIGVLNPIRIRLLLSNQVFSMANVLVQTEDYHDVAYLYWDIEGQLFVGEVAEGVYNIVVDSYQDGVAGQTIQGVQVTSHSVTERTVYLEGVSQLQVKVTAGGEPYSNARVSVLDGDDVVGIARYDEQEQLYQIEVPTGSYSVEVQPWDQQYDKRTIPAHTDHLVEVEYAGLTNLQVLVKSAYGVVYAQATVRAEQDGEQIATIYWDKAAGLYQGALVAGTYDIIIRPASYYNEHQLSGVVLAGDQQQIELELVRTQPNTEVNINTVISQNELIALAKRYQQLYYNRIAAETRGAVDEELKRLTEGSEAERLRAVNSITSFASLLGAKAMGKEIAITLGAAAVVAAPEHALAVNNFGALLRLLVATEDSVLVLNYARLLAPDSPMVLTNLASSVLELGDDDAAQQLFQQALRYDASFAQAHNGLASLYYARGDMSKTLEHMFAAAQQVYAPSMRQATEAARSSGASAPATGGATDPSSAGFDSGSGIPDVKDELYIPRLPNWPTWEALSASAANIKMWADDVTEQGLVRPLNSAMSMWQTKQVAAGVEKLYGGPYSQLMFQIECYGAYLQDRAAEVFDQYLEQVEFIGEAYNKELDSIAITAAMRMEAAGQMLESMDGIEDLLTIGREAMYKMDDADQTAGKEVTLATDRYFLAWKPLFRETYEELTRLVEEYWIYTESTASRIYDADAAEFVGELRRTAVYSTFVPLAVELPSRILLFEIGGFGPLMRPVGERKPDEAPEPMEHVAVPEPKKNSCPFADGSSFNADLGLASMKVGCETVEVKLGKGLEGGVTYNFKHKYVSSLYAGVGILGGAGKMGMGAGAGVRANFGPNGEVLSVRPEAEAKVNVGPLSENVGTADGLVVGVGPLNRPAGSWK